ncbi:helix-turn-helix domain-containing protein [Sporosarcina cascadiensis]|uniref:helix-turn-helix domain-containing protein n=1 Tax=Sporosarcina cascadiensis TaxID=2660747 RepID=UPI00129A72CC|nr:helix-turn-helix domain-containing protein [Sporosarcina cascadiensis]
MEKFIDEREVEWIVEGTRLKKLRESRHMSRAELARRMNISSARLARLENGDCVRDAHILSRFYEHIIEHQDLLEGLGKLYTDLYEMMKHYSIPGHYVLNNVREKVLTKDTKKRSGNVNYVDSDSAGGIRSKQKTITTRFNPRNII